MLGRNAQSEAHVCATGKLVMLPGYKLSETDSVSLTFAPEGQDGGAKAATLAKDMSFTIQLLPGKYKVAFSVSAYPGEKGSEKRSEAFLKKLSAFSTDKTTLTYEVTSDSVQNVTVDLAHGAVEKN